MIDPRDDPSCQACRFWQSEAGETGDCRRQAPRPLMDGALPAVVLAEGAEDTSDQAIWPVTFAGDWCGEFRERPAIFRPSWVPV